MAQYADLQRALMGGRPDVIGRELTKLVESVDVSNDKQTKTTAQVAGGANTTVTFKGTALATNSSVQAYTLRVYARQTNPLTAARLVASVPVIVYRNTGNATADVGAFVAEFGTGIDKTGGSVANVTLTVNADDDFIFGFMQMQGRPADQRDALDHRHQAVGLPPGHLERQD